MSIVSDLISWYYSLTKQAPERSGWTVWPPKNSIKERIPEPKHGIQGTHVTEDIEYETDEDLDEGI